MCQRTSLQTLLNHQNCWNCTSKKSSPKQKSSPSPFKHLEQTAWCLILVLQMLGLHTFQGGRRLFNSKRCPTSSALGAYDAGFPAGCLWQNWPNGLAKTKMLVYNVYIYISMYYPIHAPPPQKKKKHRISMKICGELWRDCRSSLARPHIFFRDPKNPMGKWTVPPAWPAAANLRECPTRRSLWSSWSFPLGH